jgi:nickel/cobalt exporter
MSGDDKDRLRALLGYWIEHNREHGEEFREWAEKARAMGEAEVAGEILEAVRAMDKAGELLAESLKRLEVA